MQAAKLLSEHDELEHVPRIRDTIKVLCATLMLLATVQRPRLQEVRRATLNAVIQSLLLGRGSRIEIHHSWFWRNCFELVFLPISQASLLGGKACVWCLHFHICWIWGYGDGERALLRNEVQHLRGVSNLAPGHGG